MERQHLQSKLKNKIMREKDKAAIAIIIGGFALVVLVVTVALAIYGAITGTTSVCF